MKHCMFVYVCSLVDAFVRLHDNDNDNDNECVFIAM